MSKLSNTMIMLVLLRAKQQMKIGEIAEILEVNNRMVQIYRDDLEKAGIIIESKPGRYGGYSLPKTYDSLLNLNLNPEEVMALNMAYKQLEESGLIYANELSVAYNKLMASLQVNKHYQGDVNDYQFVSKSSPAALSNNQEREHCKKIHASLIQKKQIHINYYSLLNDEHQERTVSPYALYEYRNSLYLTGFCHLRQEIRDFKISRIKSLATTDDYFVMPSDFSLKDYMTNCLGIFKDTTQKVVLKIRHPMSQIIREKIWSDNQVITDIPNEKAILFEAHLQGEIEIISWILSMGSDVEVIEPTDLKDKIREKLEKMIKNF
ncbi:MAG TPA: transcriptional regulator [Clostridiales bacterium]|nr:transcriptional regulator [Clostridiales bacterium]